MSFAASELSEPEPDVTITPLVSWDKQQANVALAIIEVAESSLAHDRGRKRPLYASCGVPEYWIVNLPERCIEVYTVPQGGEYTRLQKYERGQSIRLGAFADVEVRVSDVMR
jgi:Uma2 family endonuclease